MSYRQARLLSRIDPARQTGLEIGALAQPIVPPGAGDIRYVDHAPTAALKAKYATDPAVNPDDLVEVTYVWGHETLAELLGDDAPVDYVIASHVIEHVPNLIGWLREIHAVLKPGGVLSLAIPDKRQCFDYDRPLTAIADLIDADVRNLRQPSVRAIYDYLASVVTYRNQITWTGSPAPADLSPMYTPQYAYETAQRVAASGEYYDVHCWVFTPDHFLWVLQELMELGLCDFAIADFHPTVGNEFLVSLTALPPDLSAAERLERQRASFPPRPTSTPILTRSHWLQTRLRRQLAIGWDAFNHWPWVTTVKAWPPLERLRRWKNRPW